MGIMRRLSNAYSFFLFFFFFKLAMIFFSIIFGTHTFIIQVALGKVYILYIVPLFLFIQM